jgi:septation ring formation regulator EzrA
VAARKAEASEVQREVDRLEEQGKRLAREAAQERLSAHEGVSGRLDRLEQGVRGVRSEGTALQNELLQLRADALGAEQVRRAAAHARAPPA